MFGFLSNFTKCSVPFSKRHPTLGMGYGYKIRVTNSGVDQICPTRPEREKYFRFPEQEREKATFLRRKLLYEKKKIDTKEPDENDGHGNGSELEICEELAGRNWQDRSVPYTVYATGIGTCRLAAWIISGRKQENEINEVSLLFRGGFSSWGIEGHRASMLLHYDILWIDGERFGTSIFRSW